MNRQRPSHRRSHRWAWWAKTRRWWRTHADVEAILLVVAVTATLVLGVVLIARAGASGPPQLQRGDRKAATVFLEAGTQEDGFCVDFRARPARVVVFQGPCR